MTDTDDRDKLCRGMTVTVRHDPPREDRTAIIVKVPPFTDPAYDDGEVPVTDSVLVTYPHTSPGVLFQDITERIALDKIEVGDNE